MNSPLISESPASVLEHHPLGASTGYMVDRRGDWVGLVERAAGISSFAVELAALREDELDPLAEFLSQASNLPFRYLSVHGPTKGPRMEDGELVDRLLGLPASVNAIVLHPDRIGDPEPYRALGERLVIENMDSRKALGRRAEELEPLFERLPLAGFCFDVAHAWTVDASMGVGGELLDKFAARLKHVHVSSISPEVGHVPLTEADERLFASLLARCRDVPWILEAEPRLL